MLKVQVNSQIELDVELFAKINNGVSAEARKRYELLNDQLHDETITPDEHQELLRLINQIEMADAERIRALIELSQLCNITVDKIMTDLESNPILDTAVLFSGD